MPAETANRTRDETYPLFDSWRGLAAIMVFAVHSVYMVAYATIGGDHAWYRFVIHFDVAVPIFFAISGFLLYRPFVAARARGEQLAIGAYAFRRALRIVPAYWVALVIMVYWFDMTEVQSLEGWIRHLGFVQLYSRDTILFGLGQAWTLNIEVVFYAFLPIWVALAGWLVSRMRFTSYVTECAAVIGLILFAFAWQAVTLLFVDVANVASNSMVLVRLPPIQLDHLGAGMLVAILSVWVAENKRAGRPPPFARALRVVEEKPWSLYLVALAIWLVSCYTGRDGGSSPYEYTDREFFAEHVLYTPLVFLLLLPLVFGHERRDRLRRALAFRPVRYIGMISYSFYLWHFGPIGQGLQWWGVPSSIPGWIGWATLSFLATVAIGSLSFYLIEKPFMSIRYRGNRKRPLAAEAAGARAAP